MLVDRRNLTLKAGNNRSLTQKWIGPYQVIKVVSRHAYKLQYPKGIRMHHVVHSTMMKPFKNRQGEPMDLDDEQDELFYEVESIIDSKRFGRTIKYRVRWRGYNADNDTWQPIQSLQQVLDLVKEFHHANPYKPKDSTLEF